VFLVDKTELTLLPLKPSQWRTDEVFGFERKRMIRWFASNGIAANFLMAGILVAGVYTAFYRIPLEVTPARSWDTVMIEMPYRGATANTQTAVLWSQLPRPGRCHSAVLN
jgi:hypothetical protein